MNDAVNPALIDDIRDSVVRLAANIAEVNPNCHPLLLAMLVRTLQGAIRETFENYLGEIP